MIALMSVIILIGSNYFQAVLHRWPSWAPKDEYAYMDILKHAVPLVPTFGFPALFKWTIGNVLIPIIRNAGSSLTSLINAFSDGLSPNWLLKFGPIL